MTRIISLTHEEVLKLLIYYPETGEFVYKETGSIAGSKETSGYYVLKIKGERYKAHRLAWFYMLGKWPKDQIDHVNRDKGDNSWLNLREATASENSANTKAQRNSVSGVKGVTYFRGKWSARISIDYKSRFLGYFATIEEAAEAYRQAAVKQYGGRAYEQANI